MGLKGAIAVLISIAAGLPMMIWLVLGGAGYLDSSVPLGTYEVVKWILIGLTCLFYFVVSPFFIWPGLFNMGSSTLRARVISSKEKKNMKVENYPESYTWMEICLELKEPQSSRTVTTVNLVPVSRLHRLEAGGEVTVELSGDVIHFKWESDPPREQQNFRRGSNRGT